MTFTFHPDGSILAEEGTVRFLWPTMGDLKGARVEVGGTTLYDRAVREAVLLRDAVERDGGDPDDPVDLDAKQRSR